VLCCFDPWRTAAVACDVASASHESAAGISARQSRRLRALLERAARDSPLYRKILRGRREPALAELPVMRKQELMRCFDQWVTDPRLKLDELRRFVADPRRIGEPFDGRYIVWESSGSSGQPALFVQDSEALAVYDSLEALRPAPLQLRRRHWDPWLLGERIAFIGATTGHFASTVSIERLRRLNPFVARAVCSLSFLLPTPALVSALNDHAPTVVATYPSAAVLLAEEAKAGRLRIRPLEVWTGGEGLTPAMRRFVQRSFGCPVSNSYGASEFLTLASECRCGRLHLNSDWVILESVDAEGRLVPPGEPGAATLLTNLANHVQPLIRYELGDRITWRAGACECGSRLPALEVQGRVDDAIVLRDHRRRPVRLLPLALTTVLEDRAQVFDFLLTQDGDHALRLRVGEQGEAGAQAAQRAQRVLGDYLQQQGLPGVRLDCGCGLTGTRGRSGKVQRVMAG
jgi:phenylacetate-coenzyme A ligase PaaK-like adenylate-forming protein